MPIHSWSPSSGLLPFCSCVPIGSRLALVDVAFRHFQTDDRFLSRSLLDVERYDGRAALDGRLDLVFGKRGVVYYTGHNRIQSTTMLGSDPCSVATMDSRNAAIVPSASAVTVQWECESRHWRRSTPK